ncbi:proline dehydrogenase family protein [Herbiconiux sp. P17]|uniref:proline dehydrogenase family protein n=1 Tax=Herbiconiux wuyangfengii TaxID=3342794 RepID=UPI0035BAAF9C
MTAMESEHEKAADTLRRWALDEDLKASVLANPVLAAEARKVARRYLAGQNAADAVAVVRAALARGHAGSIEYAGESIRDAALARTETDVFLDLADLIAAERLPSTISFDLSHLGALVDPALGLAHARELAAATGERGIGLMISAEGSDRTDLVLDTYDALAAEHPHVGVTLQARLHRTAADLERVLDRPGRVRLVKGAFRESEEIAYRRDGPELSSAYQQLASRVLAAEHPLTVATHDAVLINALMTEHGERVREPDVEFEMLLGLGTELLDDLRERGHRTREYVIFGDEWWLYVLNRLAEHPERVITALADLRG